MGLVFVQGILLVQRWPGISTVFQDVRQDLAFKNAVSADELGERGVGCHTIVWRVVIAAGR